MGQDIYFHRLGLFELFNKLYGHITVPEAVKKELKEGQSQGEDVPKLEIYPWIKIRRVSMPRYLQLIADLGPDMVKAILELAGEE